MSAEPLQMDIDQKGKELMGFHWPMANCTALRNQINVLAPSFLVSPLSGGLLMLKLLLVGEQLQTSTDVRKCSARLLRIVGESVWSAGLWDGEPRFRLVLYIPPSDFTGNDRKRKILFRCSVASLSLWETFCIHAVNLYVLWPRSAVGNIWLNLSGWFAILNLTGKSMPGQNVRRTTGTTKDNVIVSCLQWWEKLSGLKLRATQEFDVWSIMSHHHILMFRSFFFQLNRGLCLFFYTASSTCGSSRKIQLSVSTATIEFNRATFWSKIHLHVIQYLTGSPGGLSRASSLFDVHTLQSCPETRLIFYSHTGGSVRM